MGTHECAETAAANPTALVQDYPAKAVRIVEPFGVGGGPDLLARALAPQISALWGEPVTVENIPGAGATAGPAQVAKSPADGYTLLINTNAQAYAAAALKHLPYDPLKDFVPVIPLTRQPYVLVAGKAAGVTTIAELIAAAKLKPGKLKFGSTGIGTSTHVGVEKFNQAAGIKALHVPPLPTDSNGHRVVLKSGSNTGFRPTFVRFVDDNLTVVILANGERVRQTPLAFEVASFYIRDLAYKDAQASGTSQ